MEVVQIIALDALKVVPQESNLGRVFERIAEVFDPLTGDRIVEVVQILWNFRR